MAKKKKTKKRGRSAAEVDDTAYQVFLSHATADKWLAKTLCEKIEQTGATTFRDDRDIKGGDDIPDAIRAEIIRSKEMVVLLTPESINRQWVTLEVGAAWGRRLRYRIVSVLCHVEVDTTPDMLKSKKAMPLNEFDDYLRDLRRRIERQKS